MSLPKLTNNLFWQNRAFHVDIIGAGSGLQSQQNLIGLTPLLNQTATGMCFPGDQSPNFFWDVGVREDVSIANHGVNPSLTLRNSILSNAAGVAAVSGTGNIAPSSSPVIA